MGHLESIFAKLRLQRSVPLSSYSTGPHNLLGAKIAIARLYPYCKVNCGAFRVLLARYQLLILLADVFHDKPNNIIRTLFMSLISEGDMNFMKLNLLKGHTWSIIE